MDRGGKMSTVREQLDIPRNKAKQMGLETVEILKQGFYQTASGGKVIDIRKVVLKSVEGTVTYSPDKPLPIAARGSSTLRVVIANTISLSAARLLLAEGYAPAVLNMASATHPGGGFLHGARAQEEYLARSTSLFACLTGNEMYSRKDFEILNPFYADYVIYSPHVLVFRDDDGDLMEEPYTCSILTSPAVQANVVHQFLPDRDGEIEITMWNRILKVLAVASRYNHKALMLGAWGCGAFGNDGHMIARLFKTALTENFSGWFEQVIFAIADWSPELRFISPFVEMFGL
jgi:uncharacterized protein (TIGR02452 family)